jgi:hypothetical protein
MRRRGGWNLERNGIIGERGLAPRPPFAILRARPTQERFHMNERNVIAAILAAGLLQGRPAGQFTTDVQFAISTYMSVLGELIKANLPPLTAPTP